MPNEQTTITMTVEQGGDLQRFVWVSSGFEDAQLDNVLDHIAEAVPVSIEHYVSFASWAALWKEARRA